MSTCKAHDRNSGRRVAGRGIHCKALRPRGSTNVTTGNRPIRHRVEGSKCGGACALRPVGKLL
eukprot:6673048-Prymnesium_polylepis.1